MKLLGNILLFVTFFNPAFASQSALTGEILREIKKSGLKKEKLGIHIVELDGKNEKENDIFELNSSKMFIPASVTKVLTSLAAIEILGLHHQFKTTLETDGKRQGSVVKGNLYLVGQGDPTFTSESMWNLVNNFTRSGVKVIEGDLIVDSSYFDEEIYDKNRDTKRVDRAYDAPISAMSFNWNSVSIYIRPSVRGKAAHVHIDPIKNYFNVINKTKTVSGRKSRLKVSRTVSDVKGEFPFETIVVSGTIGSRSKEYTSYKSITNPSMWAGYNLQEFLLQRGIRINGRIKVGKKPKKTLVRSEFKSRPLYNSVNSMNKFSNNFIAEMLIKNIGAKYKVPGTMDLGLKKVNEYLQRNGLKKENFVYSNSSGLTNKNLFRPKDITKILKDVRKKYSFFPEFIASLPISAVDGTLKSRMTVLKSGKKVRAKTGLLDRVVALAGYVNKNGKNYVFSFSFNGKSDEKQAARDLFDYLTETIVE